MKVACGPRNARPRRPFPSIDHTRLDRQRDPHRDAVVYVGVIAYVALRAHAGLRHHVGEGADAGAPARCRSSPRWPAGGSQGAATTAAISSYAYDGPVTAAWPLAVRVSPLVSHVASETCPAASAGGRGSTTAEPTAFAGAFDAPREDSNSTSKRVTRFTPRARAGGGSHRQPAGCTVLPAQSRLRPPVFMATEDEQVDQGAVSVKASTASPTPRVA